MRSGFIFLLLTTLATCFGGGRAVAQEICDLSERLVLDAANGLAPQYCVFADGYGYLLTSASALAIFDAATLKVLAMIPVPAGAVHGLAVKDGFAYISKSSNQLIIVDATDAHDPIVVREMFATHGHLFATDFGLLRQTNDRISTYDLSDPVSPSVIGTFTGLPWANQPPVVHGGAMYIASGGLHILDISDPTRVHLRQVFTALNDAGTVSYGVTSVCVDEETAYISLTSGQGIWVLDLSRPFIPVKTGVFGIGINYSRMWATTGVLFARSSSPASLHAFSIRDPDQPPALILDTAGEFVPSAMWTRESLVVGIGASGSYRVYGIDRCEGPCLPDFAPPFGVLNFFDLTAFLSAFAAQDPRADLAQPHGVWDFFDLSEYLAAFNAGCQE